MVKLKNLVLLLSIMEMGTWVAPMTQGVLYASEKEERSARYVDRAALQAQEKAIDIFLSQIKKRKGTAEEPHDLARLADLYLDKAELLFRISYGKNRSVYEVTLSQGIKVLSDLIEHFSESDEQERSLFLRARSYSELAASESAKADYLRLQKQFPQSSYGDACAMAIAEIEITANRHAFAVSQLQNVVAKKDGPYHALALHKLAWSYYNLGQSQNALDALVRNIRDYQAQVALKEAAASAFLENSLSDYTLFYLDAFERKVLPFDAKSISEHFFEIQPGPRGGKLILSFAKLLGAHGHQMELEQFRDATAEKYENLPQTMDIALYLLEMHSSLHRFTEMKRDLEVVVSLGRGLRVDQRNVAFEVLRRQAAQVHELISKNQKLINNDETLRQSNGFQALVRTVIEVYVSLLALQDPSDSTREMTRYNLAQTYFLAGEMSFATKEYRTVLEELSHQKSQPASFVENVSLLMVSSRFQELKRSNLAPDSLQAVNIAKATGQTDPLVKEWSAWVDAHQKRYAPQSQEFAGFQFEVARALYASGEVQVAVDRMKSFAFSNPSSVYAASAMGLVLDTLVVSELWVEVVTLTQLMASRPDKWNVEFKNRALEIGASASIKLIEGKVAATSSRSELEMALLEARKCSEGFAQSSRVADCYLLEARAAFLLADFQSARQRVQAVLNSKFSNDSQKMSALLLAAAMSEEDGNFSKAVEQLLAALGKSGSQNAELTKRALRLAWLSGDSKVLEQALKGFAVAKGEDFELYSSLLALQVGSESRGTEKQAEACFQKAYRGPAHFKSLWALSALKNAKHLPFQDTLVALKRMAEQWNEIPQETQLALAGELHRTVPRILAETREKMRSIAKVHLAEASWERQMERRMLLMAEWESAVTAVLKFPWEGIKMSALEQLALGYQDLTEALGRGLGSEGEMKILRPLEAKRQQILVELKKRQTQFAEFSGSSLTDEYLSPEAWVAPGTFKTPEQKRLVSLWTLALKNNNIAWLFSLASHADFKSGFDEDTQQVLRALALIASDAKTEGWMILSKRGSS